MVLLATLFNEATPPVTNAGEAEALFARSFESAANEQAEIAYLDHRHRVIARARITGHACDAVVLPVRAILVRALTVHADGLIVAHNHPGGDPDPSAADLDATRALAAAAALLDIRLIDHLVFAAGGCRSFRAAGLL